MSNKKKAKKIMPIILGAVILIGLIFGVREYIYYRSHADTNDAQIDGDISPVSARVGGYVKAIKFQDNQVVKAGDLLFVIDTTDYKLKLEQAKAALGEAQANVAVAMAGVTAAKAGAGSVEAHLDAAKADLKKANEDLQRYTNLYKAQAITKEQLDAASVKQVAAQSQVESLEKQLISISKNVAIAQAKVGTAKSNVGIRQVAYDFAQQQLSYTKIYAPSNGVISKRTVQVGQLVQPGQTLCAIVHSSDKYVTANFKETKMDGIKIGNKADIDVDAFPDLKIEGTVESFSGATGSKFSLLPPNNATGNYVKVVQRVPVRIKIDAQPDVLKKLRPGMSVEVSVHIHS